MLKWPVDTPRILSIGNLQHNASQNHKEILLALVRMTKKKKKKDERYQVLVRIWGERNSYTVYRAVNYRSNYRDQKGVYVCAYVCVFINYLYIHMFYIYIYVIHTHRK